MDASVQKKYIQKSKIFLYPLLGIKRGLSITPIQTYMAWDKEYSVKNHKFICVYHMRTDKEFKQFEKKVLLANPFFSDWYESEDSKNIYIFDFSSIAKDFDKIINGQYSEVSRVSKVAILNFFQNHTSHYELLMSYLMPATSYDEYSFLLDVPVYLLENVGELCNPPDLIAETLNVNKKNSIFDTAKTFNNQHK